MDDVIGGRGGEAANQDAREQGWGGQRSVSEDCLVSVRVLEIKINYKGERSNRKMQLCTDEAKN